MKVVITGATSSIGIALIEECIKQNNEVIAITNPGSRNRDKVPQSEHVKVYECSLDGLREFEINETADAFVHLAWAATSGDEARNLIVPQIQNIQYSIDAVELAKKCGCKIFVGAGSQAEYGRTNEVLTEELEARPETAYGMAKLCAGQMTRLACKDAGIRHIWPRILSAYGPNCQTRTVLHYTIYELLNGRKPSLSGGEQIWDFIHVSDVARAYMALIENGKDGEIYLIGSGKSMPLREYLEMVRLLVGDYKGDVPGLGLGEKPYGPNTVMHLECNISKLKNDTGFQPVIGFEEGIMQTIEWISEQ